ncbi:hypothetical protein BJ546DRAFT_212473 [Cryomyces antarcticus]
MRSSPVGCRPPRTALTQERFCVRVDIRRMWTAMLTLLLHRCVFREKDAFRPLKHFRLLKLQCHTSLDRCTHVVLSQTDQDRVVPFELVPTALDCIRSLVAVLCHARAHDWRFVTRPLLTGVELQMVVLYSHFLLSSSFVAQTASQPLHGSKERASIHEREKNLVQDEQMRFVSDPPSHTPGSWPVDFLPSVTPSDRSGRYIILRVIT